MQNWLNTLEPLTSHQKMEGATQRDPGFHLPRLYYYYYPQLPRMDVSGSQSVAHHKITKLQATRKPSIPHGLVAQSPGTRKPLRGKKIRTLRGQCKHKSFSIQGMKQWWLGTRNFTRRVREMEKYYQSENRWTQAQTNTLLTRYTIRGKLSRA